MHSSFELYCSWFLNHIWIAKTLAVLLFVYSGFIHGREGCNDKSFFSVFMLFFGWVFLAEAYLLEFNFSLMPFAIIMIFAPCTLWYSGFDEGYYRKSGLAVMKLVFGTALMIALFKLVEMNKLG